MLRDALVHVALHARKDHFHEGVRVVRRARDALERVATDAVEQLPLLRVRARHARHPLAVGELRGEVLRPAEPEVGAGGLLNFDESRALEFVAGSADADRVAAGLEPGCRKAVVALAVA